MVESRLSFVQLNVLASDRGPVHDPADRRVPGYEALFRADDYLFRSLRLDEILTASAEAATEILGADACVVWMWDPRHTRVSVEAASGFAPGTASAVLAALGSNVVDRVLTSGEPVQVAVADLLPLDSELAEARQLRFGLAIPIASDARVVGAMGVFFGTPPDAAPERVWLFTSFSERLARAIENARRFARARQDATLVERQRLARDLHDSVVQSLFGVAMLADAGRRHVTTGNVDLAQACLERIVEVSHRASRDVRLLVYDLRPPILEREGLVGALRLRLDAVERRVGIDGRLVVGSDPTLPPIVEECLYRIAIQALDNSLKHSHATHVKVELSTDATMVELAIVDNGDGFTPHLHLDRGGLGLATMRERAERLGGSATIESQPGRGTFVRVRLPR